MNPLEMRDPNFFTKQKFGGSVATLAILSTAASVTTGNAVDKLAVSAGKVFQGVMLSLPVEVTGLDSGQSQVVTLTLKDSTASGGTFATLGAAASTTIQNTSTVTGVTVQGVARVSANLLSAKRWVKGSVSFLGSASDTGADTVATAMALTFFGPNESPA